MTTAFIKRWYRETFYWVDPPEPDEPFVALYFQDGYPQGEAFPTRAEAEAYLETGEGSLSMSAVEVVTYDQLRESA